MKTLHVRSLVEGSIASLLLMIPVIPAHASGDKGHGGSAVVCYNQPISPAALPPDTAIISTRFNDYLEFGEQSPLPINLGPTRSTYQEKIEYVLRRVEGSDFWFSLLLRDALSKTAPVFADRTQIPTLRDANYTVSYRDNCAIVQAAVQKKPEQIGIAWVRADRKIWDRLSESDRAGLLLHEALYQIYVEYYGEKNSDRVRYLNFMLATSYLQQNPSAYDDLMRQSGLADLATLGRRVERLNGSGFLSLDGLTSGSVQLIGNRLYNPSRTANFEVVSTAMYSHNHLQDRWRNRFSGFRLNPGAKLSYVEAYADWSPSLYIPDIQSLTHLEAGSEFTQVRGELAEARFYVNEGIVDATVSGSTDRGSNQVNARAVGAIPARLSSQFSVLNQDGSVRARAFDLSLEAMELDLDLKSFRNAGPAYLYIHPDSPVVASLDLSPAVPGPVIQIQIPAVRTFIIFDITNQTVSTYAGSVTLQVNGRPLVLTTEKVRLVDLR